MNPALACLALLAALQQPQEPPPAPPAGAPQARAEVQDGAAAQEPAPVEQPPAASAWRDVDKVVAIVNGEIIPLRRLLKDLARARRERQITNDSELRALEGSILTEHVRERLRVQGGADMGLDAKLVEARVKENVRRMIERRSGVAGMSRFLQDQDLSGEDLREHVRSQMYADLWQRAATGESGAIDGRPTADRWVRPGALQFHYRNALDRPDGLQALGGSPPAVRFQQIVLDPARWGGIERTRELAASLRQRILEGADVDQLVADHSEAREDRGVIETEVPRLRTLPQEIAAFLETAEAGAVSQPLLTSVPGLPRVRLAVLLERRPAVVPDISSYDVQRRVARGIRESLDEWHLARGYQQRLLGSYVWPPEYAQQIAAPAR